MTDKIMQCPFCEQWFMIPTKALSMHHDTDRPAIVDYAILSIECPCGATFALTRGGRPHARSD